MSGLQPKLNFNLPQLDYSARGNSNVGKKLLFLNHFVDKFVSQGWLRKKASIGHGS